MLRGFWRVLKMAVQNSFRNFWLSVITISMYVLTLATINVVLFVNVFANTVTHQIEEKVEVTAYFKTDTSLDIVNAARGYMAGFAQVRETEIVTSEEAYEQFRASREADDSVLAALDEVGENPFGHALILRANEVTDFDFILSTLNGSQYVNYIEETDEKNNAVVIENLSSVSRNIQLAGLGLSIFFGLVTFLILFNAIRMAIYVHREEIAIMKLVGATDAYVRMPFLIEGMLYSFIACGIFFGAVIALTWTGFALPAWFEGVDVVSQIEAELPLVMATELVVATAIALLATWTAMARHLKV